MSNMYVETQRFVLRELLDQCTVSQVGVFRRGYGLVAEIPSAKLSSAIELCKRTIKANRKSIGGKMNKKGLYAKQRELFGQYLKLGIEVQLLGGIVQNPLDMFPLTDDDISKWLDMTNEALDSLNSLKRQTKQLLQDQSGKTIIV